LKARISPRILGQTSERRAVKFEKEFKVEQQIDLPIAEVFDFFSRAENLQRITPPLLK
jgi:hypothetical protein